MYARARQTLRFIGLACLAAAVTTCQDSQFPTLRDGDRPSFALSDGANGPIGDRNTDVFFYPPLVGSPEGKEGFRNRAANPNLKPVARICRLNATEASDGLPVPAGEPLGCDVTLTPDLAMVYNATAEIYQAAIKDGGFTLDTEYMYRIQIFVGTRLLAFRDIDPDPNPPTASCTDNPFCQFNVSSNLPIKVRIETAALCFVPNPGSTTTAGTFILPCASGQIGVGGNVVLADESGEVIGSVVVQSGGGPSGSAGAQSSATNSGGVSVVTMKACPAGYLNPAFIDLPTFGNCVDIETDPPLSQISGIGVASLCQAEAAAAGLSEAQRHRITVHNLTDAANGIVYALPDADGFCPDPTPPPSPSRVGLLFDRLRQYAQAGWRSAREQVVAWFGPQSLWASLVCDRGCGGLDFESPVQAALPAKMGYLSSNPMGNLGVGPGPRTVTAVARVSDAGGEAVANATLTVLPPSGGTATALQTKTGTDGLFSVEWTLPAEPGTYTLDVTGRGIADPSCGADCGPGGVFASDHSDPSPTKVQLRSGTLRFTAVVCRPGQGTPNSINGIIESGEWDCAIKRTDVRVNLSGGSSTFATLLYMNDNESFYLALEVPGTARDNALRIEWSNDAVLSGGRGLGDDIWEFIPGSGPFDKFVDEKCVGSSQSGCGLTDDVGLGVPGSGNQTRAAFNNSVGTKTVYEMSHPLSTFGNVERCQVSGNKACGTTTLYPIDLWVSPTDRNRGFFLTLRLGSGAQGNTQWPGFLSYLAVTIQ